jgi:hypothetical protein
MKNKSSAPKSSPRPKPAGPVRNFRNDQGKLDRAARLGDDGPKTARFAPKSSPRPKPAGPARKFRDDQSMLDRSARLGDSGPTNAGTAFRVGKGPSGGMGAAMKPGSKMGGMGGKKKGYMDGGMVKGGGKACKTY